MQDNLIQMMAAENAKHWAAQADRMIKSMGFETIEAARLEIQALKIPDSILATLADHCECQQFGVGPGKTRMLMALYVISSYDKLRELARYSPDWWSEHSCLSYWAGIMLRADTMLDERCFALDSYVEQKYEAIDAGEKGGRPSTKPMRIDLRKSYDELYADCVDDREARAKLVKTLCKERGVSASTARGWLRDAGI